MLSNHIVAKHFTISVTTFEDLTALLDPPEGKGSTAGSLLGGNAEKASASPQEQLRQFLDEMAPSAPMSPHPATRISVMRGHAFVSTFAIGESVNLQVAAHTWTRVYVRAVTFTSGKVRYALWNRSLETTLHNVDSVFVTEVPESEREIIEMPADNYS